LPSFPAFAYIPGLGAEGVDEMDLTTLTEKFFRAWCASIGEDPEREGLKGTPARILSSLHELTEGYEVQPSQFFNNALFECSYKNMVWERNIPFYSLCEHHVLPFFGHCTVAYLPSGKVIGLSKIHAIVDMYARRLQLQERMTDQIAQTVRDLCCARGVGVWVEAKHLCLAMRGERDNQAKTVTHATLGAFETDEAVRGEFLNGMLGADTPRTTLGLTSLSLEVSVGCTPSEKKRKIAVNLDLELRFPTPPRGCLSDRLRDTVCYDRLSRSILQLCAGRHFDLLEHLGYELYRHLKSSGILDDGILAKITLHKPLPSGRESRFSVGDF
jgi:GTP cyclohydrolase I